MYEYLSITDEQAPLYCAGSEAQRVRDVIASKVGTRTVLDIGCGPGIDAARYAKENYCGLDVSPALVRAAQRRNPGYRFLCGTAAELRETIERLFVVAKQADVHFRRSRCAILKSVLEHTENVAAAVALIDDALALADECVFVAWHTPPAAEEVLRQVTGHFGKLVHQNTYALSAFKRFFIEMPVRRLGSLTTVEQVDNFTLWTITR